MKYISDKLGIRWDKSYSIKAPTNSRLYWGIFFDWWNRFGLKEDGLLIGEEYPKAEQLKVWFKETFISIGRIDTASLGNSDYPWDITSKGSFDKSWDWIICQAVLEHCKDPVSAVKNMVGVLKPDGYLYLHSHGPDFDEHRWPIDCYRFMKDGVEALAELSGADVEDILYTKQHWFMLLRK